MNCVALTEEFARESTENRSMIIVSIDDGWKVCANSPLLIAQPWIIWCEYYPHDLFVLYSH